MPRQEIDGDQLYNLALSIVGLVLNDGPATVAELAQHFGVSEKAILKAVKTIGNSEDVANFRTHFYLNYDALEDGEIDFGIGDGYLDEAPMLSTGQISALAMGLEFLASLPEFSSNPHLLELRQKLGTGVSATKAADWSEDLEKLEVIRKAILSEFRIRFDYLNQLGNRSIREVDPLRIDLIGSKHYLRGYCHTNSEIRTFRLDRLTNPIATEHKISKEVLASEVPEEVYGDGFGQQVEIEASKLAEEIFWNFPAEITSVESSIIRGTIRVGNLESLARHIARYGGAVRVIAPSQAKLAIVRFAERALDANEPEAE